MSVTFMKTGKNFKKKRFWSFSYLYKNVNVNVHRHCLRPFLRKSAHPSMSGLHAYKLRQLKSLVRSIKCDAENWTRWAGEYVIAIQVIAIWEQATKTYLESFDSKLVEFQYTVERSREKVCIAYRPIPETIEWFKAK